MDTEVTNPFAWSPGPKSEPSEKWYDKLERLEAENDRLRAVVSELIMELLDADARYDALLNAATEL